MKVQMPVWTFLYNPRSIDLNMKVISNQPFGSNPLEFIVSFLILKWK